VDEKAIHERVSALRTQMAEILKADKEQKHSAPYYATKKAAHKPDWQRWKTSNKKLHLSPLGNTYQTDRTFLKPRLYSARLERDYNRQPRTRAVGRAELLLHSGSPKRGPSVCVSSII
jgi:hypothetical protein